MMSLVFVKEGGGLWMLQNVGRDGFESLIFAARLERKEGWVSDKAIGLLSDLHGRPEAMVLTDEQTSRFVEAMAAHVTSATVDLQEAVARGQRQARNCLGSMGRIMDKEVDATHLATLAIANWLGKYSGFVQPAQFSLASKVKQRERSTLDVEHWEKEMAKAVEAIHRQYPDWPIENAGVVRLNHRSNRPLTCVGVYVHFEGHQKQAILWPAET